ncbi:aldolase/citrate lyase family protein [Pseudoalteromonas xiamenensis]|uniref:aldolase/citrate lyase family protein n=1 Tax=Pseudoalteromonas xiamenensis TaxID=882626 RepID=UPI0035E7082B
MLDILKRLKSSFKLVAVKAEFEAEGTRSDEFLRLLEITRKAGLEVALKIGGAEAVRDLLEARQYGVEYVIAPMVETPYALTKYVGAIKKCFAEDELCDTKFLFNLETETTLSNLSEMIHVVSGSDIDLGIVFGRVDFTLSKSLDRKDINSPEITGACSEVAEVCKASNLELVVGGGVSIEAVGALLAIKQIHLTRFETRKLVFDGGLLETSLVEEALALAIEFELLWLQNKQDYYRHIALEDEKRIAMIQNRVTTRS